MTSEGAGNGEMGSELFFFNYVERLIESSHFESKIFGSTKAQVRQA